MSQFIPFQLQFRQPLPEIRGSKEYRDYRQLFQRVDDLLDQSGIEQEMVRKYLEVSKREQSFNYGRAINLQDKIRKGFDPMIEKTPFWGQAPGIMATLHIWTKTLRLHPHIHCLVTGGGLKNGR